jgi:predicted DsbA family dithiol-disulfide isomerase
MYNKKFGRERVAAMIPRMVSVGKTCGIDFSYGGYTGNTFDSHRIIAAAKEQGGAELQDKVVESLFKAYFEDEKSMGEKEVLIEYSERAGMDVRELLADSSKYHQEVRDEMRNFGQHCTGVPMFIIDNQFSLSGAQEADTLLQVFQQVCDKDKQ